MWFLGRKRKNMKDAYDLTISDLEIELRFCGIFEFKRRQYLIKQISHYEKLYEQLKELDN